MRVALYARVSTEEQAKHGISIDAQIDALRKWAADNGHEIVKEYPELGVSARKSPSKRPMLQQLLNDIPVLQTELIAFTKLDRWTRNVRGYYQVQDVLDKYNVAWNAITERYETQTVNGRFTVNVLLAVSEQEADRTGDRIRTALDYKVAKGEYTGGKITYGYMLQGKKLVPDPNKIETAREMFQRYLDGASLYSVAAFLSEQTGGRWQYRYIRRCLQNRLYIGEYRGNLSFCEPIIDRQTFDAVQSRLADRTTRHNPTGRVYVFAGLIRCACCGRKMTGFATSSVNESNVHRYRCEEGAMYRRCEHRLSAREDVLENWLVDNVAAELDKYKATYTITPKKKKPQRNNAAIQRKLDRLKTLYLDELITLEQYKADREKLLAQLEEPEPQHVDYTAIKKQFEQDFHSVYASLNAEQRAMFWKGTVDTIYLDAGNTPRIIFKP